MQDADETTAFAADHVGHRCIAAVDRLIVDERLDEVFRVRLEDEVVIRYRKARQMRLLAGRDLASDVPLSSKLISSKLLTRNSPHS